LPAVIIVVEGVFETDAAGGAQFHEAHALDPEAFAKIQVGSASVCCGR
jgi:hypothetical protein